MAPTTIHVKATSGAKITVSVELSLTVAELKATLAAEDKANVPANQQRLIYRGHVMKDERSVLGAISSPWCFLKVRRMYAVHADDSIGRSMVPVGGWKM